MYRWSRRASRCLIAALAAGWLVVAATPVPAADDVAAFLERHGLTELLAAHLEDALEESRGEERETMLVRLAGLYAELLETVDDAARRLELTERSRRLVETAPRGTTDELRLALLRATFRSAERVAENHRLRLETPEAVEHARELFGSLIPEFVALSRQTESSATVAERRLNRASGSDAIVLSETAEKARRVNAQCKFLTGWALYYQAWLTDRPEQARVAQRHFAELLDLDQQDPDDVSVDLRSTEAIARCILGMALCKAMTASTATALEWVGLLDHERTFTPLREQAPAWRLAVLLEDGEFVEAKALFDRVAAERSELPLNWLRLVAVHAIEGGGRSRTASELARFAVTELAARGELDQVLDLASRYGTSSLGASGFALRYVDGVLKYHEARAAHDTQSTRSTRSSDTPTSDESIRAAYREAMAQFTAARAQPDASRYPRAAVDCIRLGAWCLYFQGELVEAREAFERAADELPIDRAVESLWMAIVCLDRLVAADRGNQTLADALSIATDRFLAEYPSSEHAPTLVLRRALKADVATPSTVEELLAIPANSRAYDPARRRATQLLYRLFREASGSQRVTYGGRFLLVAMPLHVGDREKLDPLDEAARTRFLVGSRRLLEVSLDGAVARLVAARAVLGDLETLESDAPGGLDPIRGEITYRRLQERLLSGDPLAAGELADDLHRDAPGEAWTRLASRRLFAASRDRLAAAEIGSIDALRGLVVRYGQRVLVESRADESAFGRPEVLAYAVAAAEASDALWKSTQERAYGEGALALFERLLLAWPRNARFLHATALLSEAFGDPQTALDCWRTLVAGTPVESDGWFEARFHVIDLLARLDPPRARALMDQHHQLHPDYGPDPWGARLRALDRRLPAAAAPQEGIPPPDTSPDTPPDARSRREEVTHVTRST